MDRLTDMVDTMIKNGEIVLNDQPEFEGEDEWLNYYLISILNIKMFILKNIALG